MKASWANFHSFFLTETKKFYVIFIDLDLLYAMLSQTEIFPMPESERPFFWTSLCLQKKFLL